MLKLILVGFKGGLHEVTTLGPSSGHRVNPLPLPSPPLSSRFRLDSACSGLNPRAPRELKLGTDPDKRDAIYRYIFSSILFSRKFVSPPKKKITFFYAKIRNKIIS